MAMNKKELEGWKKALAESGIKYDTDEEYEEAIHNLIGYFQILIEMDKQAKDTNKTKKKSGKNVKS